MNEVLPSEAIDIELFRAKDFMQRKENGLLQNRKLKDFYQRYNEASNVSVFTMAENAGLLRENDVFGGPEVGETNLDFNPIYKQILEEKKAIREGRELASSL